MKNISKKIIAAMIVIMVVLAGATVANAATINATLSSNDKLVAGSTITININVDKPIYGMSATLSYDNDVFESATVASSVATSADLSNNVIVIESGTAMPAGTVGTITLKVKDNISKTEAKVSLSGGRATDEAVTTQSLNSPSVTIKADSSAESGSEETPANTPVAVTTNNTTKNTTKNITSSKSKTKIPAAGDTTTIVITAAVAVIAIVGIVGFVKYAKNRDIK